MSANVVNNDEIGNSGSGNEIVERLSLYMKSTIRSIDYLTPNTKVIFIQLRETFSKAGILCYFNLKYHI